MEEIAQKLFSVFRVNAIVPQPTVNQRERIFFQSQNDTNPCHTVADCRISFPIYVVVSWLAAPHPSYRKDVRRRSICQNGTPHVSTCLVRERARACARVCVGNKLVITGQSGDRMSWRERWEL